MIRLKKIMDKECKLVKEKKKKHKTSNEKDKRTTNQKPSEDLSTEKKQLSIKHKTILVELYFLHRNYQRAADSFVGLHPEFAGLAKTTVFNIVQRFRESGSVFDRVRTGRPKSVNNEFLIEMFSAKIATNPNITVRQLAKEGGISKTSVLRILKEARFQPYKIARAKAIQEQAANKKGKTVPNAVVTVQKSTGKRPSVATGELTKDRGASKQSVTGFQEMNGGTSYVQGGNCTTSVAGFQQQTAYHPYQAMPPYDGGYGNYYNVAQ